jgi:hypothetical protein
MGDYGLHVVTLWLALVGLGAYTAKQKGRPIGEGVLLGLFFGPVGAIVEALLPDARDPVGVDLVHSLKRTAWKCNCGGRIVAPRSMQGQQIRCPHCNILAVVP